MGEVAVIGASGFVGGAVCQALAARGIATRPLRAPRIRPLPIHALGRVVSEHAGDVDMLADQLQGVVAVVNAAGISDSGSGAKAELFAANAAVAGVVAAGAARAGARLVHVSSAAVQGRTPSLDDSRRVAPFSAYSASKAAGEDLVLTSHPLAIAYRPPGVHGPGRSVTGSLAALARSRFSSTARPGTANTAQALMENVADAIAFLATTDLEPPRVVSHPSEGLSTAGLLTVLGGRQPLLIPEQFAHFGVGFLYELGRLTPRATATARRLEMLWLGQDQAESWLTTAGWTPPVGVDGWAALGHVEGLHERTWRKT